MTDTPTNVPLPVSENDHFGLPSGTDHDAVISCLNCETVVTISEVERTVEETRQVLVCPDCGVEDGWIQE